MKVLKESDYKCITIDWLFRKGLLGNDAVLINELPVDGFSRRADLVVANGKLHAFEIKSDADSLVRLQGQINTYLSFFDKVTLVCSRKFSDRAMELLPKEVEILELSIAKGAYSLKYRRRGKINEVSSPREYLSFVDKRSLMSRLKSEGVPVSPSDSNLALYRKASTIAKSRWREITLNYLKDKYSETYRRFLDSRGSATDISDVCLLSPRALIEADEMELIPSVEAKGWEEWKPSESSSHSAIDVSGRMAQYGFVTKGPVMLIPRSNN
ncbi:sce7726 family protein [Vibrio sp. SCSIO 43169]|uniref:sce7726 family protein n=1 Tax=Vibrio sp. SCSIO 43169 TaxID=2822801 RepID=UPI002043F18B|nr:sce7726 family protein [Vibrio sp. SCSIO 43169]MCM5510789.1 sce7726 family protein [Vibrio sp. SCSIO 43169]